MSIQYLILDIDNDDEYVFDTPEENPMDMDDPEVGLSYYYEKLNQTRLVG